MSKPFWHEGMRFECQGTGRCCTARGQYGYVYVTLEDRRHLAAALHMRTSDFTRKYCRLEIGDEDGDYFLRYPDRDCEFLDGACCSVYVARPTQCRTWPFWPENMNLRVWRQEVLPFCEGVGKGRLYSAEEIAALVAKSR